MPSASDYIRSLRLSTQQSADTAASSLKFRGPKSNTSYDPSRIEKKAASIYNFKTSIVKSNTFYAKIRK